MSADSESTPAPLHANCAACVTTVEFTALVKCASSNGGCIGTPPHNSSHCEPSTAMDDLWGVTLREPAAPSPRRGVSPRAKRKQRAGRKYECVKRAEDVYTQATRDLLKSARALKPKPRLTKAKVLQKLEKENMEFLQVRVTKEDVAEHDAPATIEHGAIDAPPVEAIADVPPADHLPWTTLRASFKLLIQLQVSLLAAVPAIFAPSFEIGSYERLHAGLRADGAPPAEVRWRKS